MGLSYVDQFEYGVYVAKNHEGKYIIDQEGNHLSISSKKNDTKRMRELAEAARSFGIDNIQFEFRSGATKISDEEFEEQLERQRNGQVPDKYDLGVMIDDYKKGRLQ
jgi:hypothetical protein